MRRSSKQITVMVLGYMIYRLCRIGTVVLVALLLAVLWSIAHSAQAAQSSTQHPENHCPVVAATVYQLVQAIPAKQEEALAFSNEALRILHRTDYIMTNLLYVEVLQVLLAKLPLVVADRKGVGAELYKQAFDACNLIMKGTT